MLGCREDYDEDTLLTQFTVGYHQDIRRAAAQLADEKMPGITRDLFELFEKDGSRLPFEKVYFGRRRFLAVYGLAAYLEKEEQGRVSAPVLRKLTEVMEDICGEECWALPAHVNTREDPDWRITVDLFAAETAQTLSDLADTLRGELPEGCYEMVREQVERRVLHPFFRSQRPYSHWEHGDTNWNAVCAGSIGSACLHLMKGQEELGERLKRVCEALPFYISGFAEDGACMEGLAYFTYGMTYFVCFAMELSEYTGGRADLLRGEWAGFHAGESDKRGRIAAFQEKCYFADGRTLSFSDADSRDTFRVGLTCALIRHFPDIGMPDLSRAAGLDTDSCYRFAALKMDLLEPAKLMGRGGLRPDNRGTGKDGKGVFQILPSAQWCIGQSEAGPGMACKGGHNEEPHNHNDIGHFLYEAGGVFLLTDLGAGEYTKEYFSEGRYDIFCNHSFSHSVPVIDGEGQRPGSRYRCSYFDAKPDGSVTMELAEAYREGLAESCRRSIAFEIGTGRLEVQDYFIMPGGRAADIRENIVTQIKPECRGKQIILKEGGVTGILTVDGETAPDFTVKEYVHSNHKGRPESVYTIQWKVALSEGRGCSRFIVTI